MHSIENPEENIIPGLEKQCIGNGENTEIGGFIKKTLNNAMGDVEKVLGDPYFQEVYSEGDDYGVSPPTTLISNQEVIFRTAEELKEKLKEISTEK
ncbi:MAG TPA: hypothetical protein PLX95_01460 [bacterium]|nr:hypothetical protein [bacterium]